MFQTTAFQSYAFQVTGTSTPSILLGGKDYPNKKQFSYHTPYATEREKKYNEKIRKDKTELQKLDSAVKEFERQKALATKNKVLANKKLAAENLRLEIELANEINRLEQVRVLLMQRIRQNEDALIVLLMMKRRRLRVA